MKIAILAPFEEQVPPKKYGGTELVVYNSIEGLVAQGHEVTLLATGDSHTSATLVPIFPQSIRILDKNQDGKLREAYKYLGLGKVLAYLKETHFDVIHNHIGWRALPFIHLMNAPVVTTLHGPLDAAYQQLLLAAYKEAPFISISLSQQKPMPDLNYIANVYNGIEVEKFHFNATPQDYFAFLGRMSPEKGPVQAIKIAKAAGVKLVMAAKIDTVDKNYFQTEIEPLIDGEQIKFIGEVDHQGKVALLNNAVALLAPIQWEEPFGLFLVEALACGTPVIAIKRGSVPELLEDGKTGYLIDPDENQIAQSVEAIKKIHQIDRSTCRQIAETRFDVKQMVEGYEKVYQALIDQTKNVTDAAHSKAISTDKPSEKSTFSNHSNISV